MSATVLAPSVPASRNLFIASYVPPVLRRTLRMALGEDHRVAEAGTWRELESIVRSRSVDLIVVDPAIDGGLDVSAMGALMAEFPRTPVLLYTSPTGATMGAMSELARKGLKDVVLAPYADAPLRIQKTLERAAKKPPVSKTFSTLADAIDTLPGPLARVLEQVFESPRDFQSIADIAAKAEVPLTRLYRSLRSAGFCWPRRVLVAARVLRAHGMLREPGSTIRTVAARLGYSHPRIFARHTMQSLGVKPRQFRRRMSDEVVAERLVEWIYDPDAAR